MRTLLLCLLVATRAVAQDAPAPAPEAAAPAPAPAVVEGPITVAVLDFKAAGDVEGISKALTTLVTNEVGSRAGYKAVSRGELRSIVAHQADAQMLGCVEAKCLADVGKLANAQRVIGGAIEHAEGDAVVFSLSLIDTEGPVILDRFAWTWRGNVDDMVDLARPAVDRLLLGKGSEALHGDLEVLAPEGSAVTVDDKDAQSVTRGLAIGVHHVEVRKSGYVPWKRDVAVTANDTRVVQVDLVDEASLVPWYARWYVWGSALAGVVLVGGTVAAVGTYQYLQTPSTLVVGGPK